MLASAETLRRRPLPWRLFALMLLGALLALAAYAFAPRGAPATSPPVATPLPDPATMARASIGTPPISTTLAFWQARVDADPTDVPSRRFFAKALMAEAAATGDLTGYERAEAQFRIAVGQSPTDPGSLLGLGSARAAQHDFATTAALARRVLARDPASIAARISLGDAEFELGHYASARRVYGALERLVPGTSVTASRAARVATLEGRPADALAAARTALVKVGDLDQRPADAAFYWFQLATYELNAGRLRPAARHLHQGLRVDAGHLPSLELLARVRAEQGRLRDARDRYRDLVERTPAADLYGDLAKIERALGERDAADADLATGLTVGRRQLARFPAERRHLAAFFADADPAAALGAARADYAQRQDIQSAGILAWAEYRTGDITGAVRHSREALRFGTADAVLRAQGGLVEAAAGNEARARRLLRSALAIRPRYDIDWAPRARATLRALTRGTAR